MSSSFCTTLSAAKPTHQVADLQGTHAGQVYLFFLPIVRICTIMCYIISAVRVYRAKKGFSAHFVGVDYFYGRTAICNFFSTKFLFAVYCKGILSLCILGGCSQTELWTLRPRNWSYRKKLQLLDCLQSSLSPPWIKTERKSSWET